MTAIKMLSLKIHFLKKEKGYMCKCHKNVKMLFFFSFWEVASFWMQLQ